MDTRERANADVQSATETSISLEELPLHSTNLLTVLDADGTIQYESPAIERIFGYDQAELVGENVADYFHPADRASVLDAFRNVVTGEMDGVATVEFRHACRDGSYCWVESASSPNPTADGYYVVNTRDITPQKGREAALVEQNERLDEFANVLSHDLRNPLQVAKGNLELARAAADSERLGEVERAHDRMETLIEQLLAVAKNDGTENDPVPVDLQAVVREAWWAVDTEALTLETQSSMGLVADRFQLQQLLENLFRNTADHAGPGVTVTVGSLPAGFYVEDDGVGIDEANRIDVFERQYSTLENGTGLGLRIVEQIVDAHDWTIEIRDADTGGARFEVSGVERTT